MAISKKMVAFAERSSWIRRMFEEGGRLKARYGADNVFDFSLGNPDLPPPPRFKEVLQRMVDEEGPGRHAYMPNGGYLFVREKVAAGIGHEQGVPLAANELIMTCGAAGAINVTLKALLDPGDEVILLAPYFVEYNFYVDNHGGVAKVVNTDAQFNLDLTAIEQAISPRTKAVIINSPNNPTGQIYPAATLLALGKLLADHGRENGQAIYLLSDEPYRKIVYDNEVVPSIFQACANSLVLSSYSKDLSLPGERIGFIAVAVIMALGSLHNPGALGRKCYGLLAALAALAGGAVAARHVWLRHLPPDQVPDCGPGLAYMLDAFPLGKTITSVFTGSGECAAADGWMFLHLDMPSWTLIWFAGLLLVAVYGGFRARG